MFRVLLVVVSACAVLLSDPCNVAASSSFSSSSSPSDSDVSSDSVPSSSSSSSSSLTPQHHQLSKLRQQIRVIQDELKEPNIESSGENENERFMDADKNVASDDDENDDDEEEPSDDSGSSADSNSAEKSGFFWGPSYVPSYELAHAYKAAVKLTDAAKANGAHHLVVSALEAHENNLKNRVNLVHHLYPSVVPYRPSSVLKSQARAELGYHWWSHYPLFPHYVFPDYGATNVYDPAFALSYANYNYNAYRNGNYNYNAYRNGNYNYNAYRNGNNRH